MQRQNEQDVRPVGEEGRRDGDVVITGTRAPHAEEREKRERRALELSRRWFFLPSRSGDLFLNEEAFLTWVPTIVRSGGGDGASDEGRDVLLFGTRSSYRNRDRTDGWFFPSSFLPWENTQVSVVKKYSEISRTQDTNARRTSFIKVIMNV